MSALFFSTTNVFPLALDVRAATLFAQPLLTRTLFLLAVPQQPLGVVFAPSQLRDALLQLTLFQRLALALFAHPFFIATLLFSQPSHLIRVLTTVLFEATSHLVLAPEIIIVVVPPLPQQCQRD
ncbi:MAG: hypothetical protein ACKVPX_12525 [Myxococcaceae bacterium]